MDDERLLTLSRRILDKREYGQRIDEEYLLDTMEIVEEFGARDRDDLLRQHAEVLWTQADRQLAYQLSRTDPFTWDVLRTLVRRFLEAADGINPKPPPAGCVQTLLRWGLRAFTELCPRPPGDWPEDMRPMMFRDHAIVVILHQFRVHKILPVTTNNADGSGCHAMARRLKNRRSDDEQGNGKLTVHAIRETWKRNKALLEEDVEAAWSNFQGFAVRTAQLALAAERDLDGRAADSPTSIIDGIRSDLFGRVWQAPE